jgi:PIN domain nuclease of toxin-antitoxin system
MRLLVDTHVFLWLLYAPERLGPQTVDAVSHADSVALSIASLWELALKHGKGKLPHDPAELSEGADALNLDELALSRAHLRALQNVVLPHGDPFDALLVAQATAEGRTLMTADRLLLGSEYATVDARR